MRELEWYPAVQLNEGLRQTIEYFEKMAAIESGGKLKETADVL
jgi:hypothetical protein